MIYESVWYPMIWGERSTADISIRVPRGQTAVSVGKLMEIKDDGEYSTFVWWAYIPTRGISFTAADYKLKSTLYKHTDVKCYIFSKAPYIANKCLQISIDILDFYSSKFGEYPYSKFAVAEIPEFFSGGHGDQGFIMMDSNLFRSSLPPEFLAHEIAHNWWGALVFAEGENTLRSVKGFWNFPEVQSRTEGEEHNYWLLEGFATYSGLLYTEHKDGREKMIDSLEDKRKEYLDKIKEYSDEPIVRVEEEYGEGRYHAIVYSKGAWVLHMLRYVVGDQIYFDIMRNYARQFEGKSANIEDFQEISEEIYGRDMDWFFDQWVRGTALPDYAIGDVEVAENSGRYYIRASILQRGDTIQMPVDITLHTKGPDVTKRVWIDEPIESVTFTADARPGYLEIDQDYWILESNKFNNIYFFEYSPTLKTLKSIVLRLKRILYLF
jgi:aminopeptidase N